MAAERLEGHTPFKQCRGNVVERGGGAFSENVVDRDWILEAKHERHIVVLAISWIDHVPFIECTVFSLAPFCRVDYQIAASPTWVLVDPIQAQIC